jgi:riboflavin kinase/FMN adenylyltransferase
MYVHRDIHQLPRFRRAVVTIGTFDGVHTGHQQLLRQLKEQAALINGETVIITFDPHPRKIVHGAAGPGGEISLINTLGEKIGLLDWQGLDHLVIVPFTEAFSQLTAEQYIKEFLLEKFHPHTIMIGYDHQFGKGRLGNYRLLEQLSQEGGYELQEIPVHVSDAISVSSTRIRDAIRRADIEEANLLLGYDFSFFGKVVEGRRLGRTIGYPTANLEVAHPGKLIPGDGVYAVEVEIMEQGTALDAAAEGDASLLTRDEPPARNSLLRGMMNIGMRPTVDGSTRTIEVNIFDFSGSIYGRMLRVTVRRHLRGEQKFSGLDALKEQLAKDKVNASALLER